MPDRKLARRTVAFLAVCAVAVALAALDSFRDYLLAPWHRRVLLEGDFRASSRAADRLAKIGAIETTPLLMRAYAEKDPYSEWNHYIVAMQHFLDLDPERTVTLVASCLRDPAAPVRLSAAFFLDGSCDYPGTDGLCIARFAVPEMVALLSNPEEHDSNTRGFCIRALGRIGRPARAALGVLREIARADRSLSTSARDAIARIEGIEGIEGSS